MKKLLLLKYSYSQPKSAGYIILVRPVGARSVEKGVEKHRMIKKIKNIFQSYMIRPMIYQSAAKISVALALALLWNRFFNPYGLYSVVRDAFFVAGLFFFMLAWFQYLRLDGMRVHHLLEERRKKKRKRRHGTMDIVDFVDEKVISFDELEDEEKIVCRLLGDLICGFLFFIPAIIAVFI